MRVAFTGFKGGTGKTTSALNTAEYFQTLGPTLYVDGDPNLSGLEYVAMGPGVQFAVCEEKDARKLIDRYHYVVIDTEARPDPAELRNLGRGADLLVLPSQPTALALKGLLKTIRAFVELDIQHFRCLLTVVPPPPSRDGDEARDMLKGHKLPIFKTEIRRRAAFQRAEADGITVDRLNDGRAQIAWGDYIDLGKEILKWQSSRP